MRVFTILAAIMITTAIYDIGGKEMPWLKALAAAVFLTLAFLADSLAPSEDLNKRTPTKEL